MTFLIILVYSLHLQSLWKIFPEGPDLWLSSCAAILIKKRKAESLGIEPYHLFLAWWETVGLPWDYLELLIVKFHHIIQNKQFFVVLGFFPWHKTHVSFPKPLFNSMILSHHQGVLQFNLILLTTQSECQTLQAHRKLHFPALGFGQGIWYFQSGDCERKWYVAHAVKSCQTISQFPFSL